MRAFLVRAAGDAATAGRGGRRSRVARIVRRLALSFVLLLVAPAAAQAAAIDDFTDSLAIGPTGATTAVISTASFSVQGGEPTGADGVACPERFKTAWFSITGNGQPIAAAIDASTFDAVIAVFPTTGAAATPTFGTRAACVDGPGNTGSAIFPTERGRRYLVQVGGKSSAGGSVRMKFTVARPGNDDRAAAMAVVTDAPFSTDQSGATSEAGETLVCDAAAYAATIWFRYTATEATDIRFTTSASLVGAPKAGDTVLAVYRGSDPAAVACNDDADAGGGSSVALRVTPGDYLLQVGAKGGETPSLGAGTVTLLAADIDHDRDESLLPADCDDRNAQIRPGAADVPGNQVDEDCSGADAVVPAATSPPVPTPPGGGTTPGGGGPGKPTALPRVRASISTVARATRKSTTFTKMTVKAPTGAKVVVSCRGKGCPSGKRTRKVAKTGNVKVAGIFKGRKLKPGAVIRILITAAGTTGREFRLTVRSGKPPKRADNAV